MGTLASRMAMLCTLCVGFLLWPGTSPADPDRDDERRRTGMAFRPAQGQEVVGGSYRCDGTVYTDDQDANVSAGAWFGATSGITDGYFGNAQTNRDVPPDLDVMTTICEEHVRNVMARIPGFCTVGPVDSGVYTFGNGSSTVVSFEFSCQGSRDQVVSVIGGFGRLALTERL